MLGKRAEPMHSSAPARPLLAGACLLLLGACGGLANTPQQDLAYERWAKCSGSGQLDRIDLDGRITFRASSAGNREEIGRCLVEAGRAGPPLPAPVGIGFPGGP